MHILFKSSAFKISFLKKFHNIDIFFSTEGRGGKNVATIRHNKNIHNKMIDPKISYHHTHTHTLSHTLDLVSTAHSNNYGAVKVLTSFMTDRPAVNPP